ncbi:LuxR C-terminal-related transcriptional regulator, partial [Solirubrobacter phytolaccae]
VAAAAAFLEQATALTPDPRRRGLRALAAAETMLRAGAFDGALVLLTTAAETPLDALSRARVDLLRGQIAFASRHGAEAASLLLAAARRLEPLDDQLARETYLEAFSAARLAGRAGEACAAELADAVRRLPPRSGEVDLVLESLAARFTDGYAAAVPVRRRVVKAFRRDDLPAETGLRWLWLASSDAAELWDEAGWMSLSTRHNELARAVGALSVLPLTLHSRAVAHVLAGEFAAAEALISELDAVQHATGTTLAPYSALGLAAWRGREQELTDLIAMTLGGMVARGEGVGLLNTQWARAVLANGHGRFQDAVVAGQEAAAHPNHAGPASWALSELVEAGVKSGQPELARDAFAHLEPVTRASGTDWALGIQARAQALLSDDERDHREAIERLGRTRVRGELARAQLLYGEWLCLQDGRGADARAQLRLAFDQLTQIGADAFAERARRGLQATGESVRRPANGRHEALTAQETHIARLAADGHTNPEIAARLFLSPRTVEYHLHKVFGKLGISSRRELADALP